MADQFNILDFGPDPERQELWWHTGKIISGNAFTLNTSFSQAFNTFSEQSFANINDEVHFDIALDAGNYVISALGIKSNDSAINKFQLNDTDIFTGIDWYSNVQLVNTIQNNNFSISTSGKFTLKSVVTGKNGASIGHDLKLTKIWIRKQ